MTRFLYLCSEIVKHEDMTIELFLRLLGSLALLIYGMKTMSDALQKMAGPSLRHVLARMTGNRLSDHPPAQESPYAQNIVSRTGFGYVFED